MEFFMARRKLVRFSSCWAMFSATSCAVVSTSLRLTSTMLSCGLADHLFHLLAQTLHLGGVLAQDHAGTCAVEVDADNRVVTLDLDAGHASCVQSFLQEFPDLSGPQRSGHRPFRCGHTSGIQSLMTPTRKPWGFTFCPIKSLPHLLLLSHHDGDVRSSFVDAIATVGAGAHTLDGHARVRIRGGDKQLGSVHTVIVLRVGCRTS